MPFVGHSGTGKTTELRRSVGTGVWGRERHRGTKGVFMVLEMFYILTVAVLTQLAHLSELPKLYTLKG